MYSKLYVCYSHFIWNYTKTISKHLHRGIKSSFIKTYYYDYQSLRMKSKKSSRYHDINNLSYRLYQ